jgi:hypothetical protein
MSESIVDFAGLDSAAAAATAVPAGSDSNVQAPPDTTENTGADNAEVKAGEGTEGTEGAEQGAEKNEDGSPKDKTDASDNAKSPTPQNVRQALKSWRDSDPENKENASVVKELHNAYERKLAYDAEFKGGVMEARKTTAWLKEISGGQGLQAAQESYLAAQEQITQINATDELLYAGSPDLISNIVEDLKGAGKIDALGKMAPAFLDALKANDPAGYVSTLSSLLPEALRDAEVDKALNAAFASIDQDPARAKSLLKGIGKWLSELEGRAETAKRKQLDPERQALAKEKSDFETSKVKEVQTTIARENDLVNNKVLGNDLKHYLKEPFFRAFSRENLIPLGNTIKAELFSTLKADKAYQSQMRALWANPKANAAKIAEYHKAKLESISAETVRNVVDRMYPGHAKGGQAAGRVADAKAKAAANQKANATSVATGKPQYVAAKPKLDEIDWSKDPKEYLHIAGRAYLKSGKYVTWRKG